MISKIISRIINNSSCFFVQQHIICGSLTPIELMINLICTRSVSFHSSYLRNKQDWPLSAFFQAGVAYAASQDHPHWQLDLGTSYRNGAGYCPIPCWKRLIVSNLLELACRPERLQWACHTLWSFYAGPSIQRHLLHFEHFLLAHWEWDSKNQEFLNYNH